MGLLGSLNGLPVDRRIGVTNRCFGIRGVPLNGGSDRGFRGGCYFRVPVLILGTFVQAHLYGVTPFDCMYQYEKLIGAHRKFLQDYKPDLFSSPAFAGSGNILDTLGYKQYRWPGHGISESSAYQYVEGEYMGAEE